MLKPNSYFVTVVLSTPKNLCIGTRIALETSTKKSSTIIFIPNVSEIF